MISPAAPIIRALPVACALVWVASIYSVDAGVTLRAHAGEELALRWRRAREAANKAT